MISGQRCLVTGGAGTIGSTIVDQLVEAGAAEVVVLDNLVRGSRENLRRALASGSVRLIEGDIRDRRSWRRSWPGLTWCSTRRRSGSRSVRANRGSPWRYWSTAPTR